MIVANNYRALALVMVGTATTARNWTARNILTTSNNVVSIKLKNAAGGFIRRQAGRKFSGYRYRIPVQSL